MVPPEILLFDAERVLKKWLIIEKAICDHDMFDDIDWYENVAASMSIYAAAADNSILVMHANMLDNFAQLLKSCKEHALASIEMDKRVSSSG
jgi:hypothetical protein